MVDYLKSRIRPIRYITGIISVLLMVISLGAFAIKGLNMGLDFTEAGWSRKRSLITR